MNNIFNSSEEYIISASCGELRIKMSRSQRRCYLSQKFYGTDFSIGVDSLKFDLISDKFDIQGIRLINETKEHQKMKTGSYLTIKNQEVITTTFIINIKKDIDPNNLSQKDILQILPCNYIMCNGEPVIKDTINVDLGIQITSKGQIKF